MPASRKRGMVRCSRNKHLQSGPEVASNMHFFFARQQLSAFCKKMVAFYYKIIGKLSSGTKSLILCIFSSGVNLRHRVIIKEQDFAMSTSTEFVTRGILKYLSQSAMFMGAACVAVALPVEAKTERQAPAKVVAKQTRTKATRDDAAKAAVLKRAASKDKAVLQVKHVKGLAKPMDDEEEAAPRGKKLKLANAKAGRNAKAEAEEATPAGRKGKAAQLAKARDEDDKRSARNKIAGKIKGAVADEEALAPKGRKLTKAERIKAERQARLDKEETARQQRIESTRDKRLQAQRKAREEAAEQARLQQVAREKRQQEIARLERQQEQARQQRMVAAREARERALEEDRIATLVAERGASVRVMEPAAAAATAVATQVAAAPAPVSYVPATPAAAPMTTPVAVARAAAPAPVRTKNMVSASSPLASSLIGSQVEPQRTRPYTYTPNPSSPVAAAMIAPEAPSRAPVTRSYVAESSSPVAASLIATAAPTAVTRVAAVPERSNFVRVSVPANNTLGQIRGMSTAGSPLALNSAVALVMDQNTGEVLLNKNGGQVSPIASITKLMTALVTMDAALPMDERITITYDDVDRLKGSSSRLSVGSSFTRQELLHLALMSSENRAAHALGRTYPGGMPAFVRAMNMRATMLGMRDTNYVEPTGLNSGNQSSARDLALLTRAAYSYPLIRSYTTHPGQSFDVAGQTRRFNNTNRLVHSNNWNIGLQKTGYISEAGRCVVMQSNIDGRNVIIVLLDSNNSSLRVRDAESIRYWVQNNLGRGNNRGFGGVVAQAY